MPQHFLRTNLGVNLQLCFTHIGHLASHEISVSQSIMATLEENSIFWSRSVMMCFNVFILKSIIYLTLGPLVALVFAVAVGALLVIWSQEFDSFGVLATEADPVLHTT